ncbi:uncharacterized protein BO97DRAFT_395961 [Aspergillus homomorphus CBS 101889]|uniref:G domain-containing protein n=1 Tax=Aspergillus homomorphus (strain CBS 101889) TaxID=1450537 RepID=A0A395HNY3_ASPHC|nr:hypothetical protein BO97DRAFT_395961 [Aspergillus homomorphus CBS 101889]RAL09641.1 hypothetical protein BO97DRAFT_395961 [Aspergillus homomorphus CBS 101889]
MPAYIGRMVPRATGVHRLSSRLRSQAVRRPLHLLTRPEILALRTPASPSISKQLRSYSTAEAEPTPSISPSISTDLLPICCPGCGAYAQTVEPSEPGYYSRTRKQTRKLHKKAQRQLEGQEADGVEEGDVSRLKAEGDQAVERIQQYITTETAQWGKPLSRPGKLLQEAADTAGKYLAKTQTPIQICDRCHDLIHHNEAVPAVSPTIDSIRAYLDESPHKENHVYLLVDAADFPMSFIDNIHEALNIMSPRSKNRRSATQEYRSSKKLPTLSIVITRSDLLAPTKEQVDSKMQYVRDMLRTRLGLSQGFRLGNVHMISAHRGWWTKDVKEEIRNHVGGVWVVGKANVGKSSFIEACFPKDTKNLEKIADLVEQREKESRLLNHVDPAPVDTDGLLPPAPREEMFPVLPIVSSLAGTTVSPIRIPFGRGRGEMIDLPGLERGDLSQYVLPEHRRGLIMTKRSAFQRLTVKPGQSLLLGGGLVRITPVNPEDVILAACFVPLATHVTRTEKAIEMQRGERALPGDPFLREDALQTIASAGRINLQWDVTQSHLPHSLARAVAEKRIKNPKVPYRVLATDLLIEGCGWIELTMQTRTKQRDAHALNLDEFNEDLDDDDFVRESQEDDDVDAGLFTSHPQVEVFSPHGRHIGSRAPLECWKYIAEKKAADKRVHGARGRQNISRQHRVSASRGE